MCSFYEHGNRNEIVHKFFSFSDHRKLIINIKCIELSELVLENLQSNVFLSFQLHSPFQLVVLDGRIVNCHSTPKIITNHSKFFTIVNLIIDMDCERTATGNNSFVSQGL